MADVAILVSEQYAKEPYRDDLKLQERLESQGMTAEIVRWDQDGIDFSKFQLAIIRSCWDYDYRVEEFLTRMKQISDQCALYNPYRMIKENSSKHYLKDLARQGIPIVPTVFIQEERELEKKLDGLSGEYIIVKPTISASGRDTHRCRRDDFKEIQAVASTILKSKDVMIQPYMESIETRGERSTVVVGKTPVFTMKKTPDKGNFLVHRHWGGTYEKIDLQSEDKKFLQKVLNGLKEQPLYMRIDFVYDEKDRPLLLELELIEPNLYLNENKRGLELLSKEIEGLLTV